MNCASDLVRLCKMRLSNTLPFCASHLQVLGQRLHLCDNTWDGCKVVFDTGTSLITAPTHHYDVLREALGFHGHCCANTAHQLPNVTFIVEGGRFELSPNDYLLKSVSHSQATQQQSNCTKCTLGLMSMDVPPPRGPLWIFGNLFMRAFYTVFNRENNSIGLARSRRFDDDY